MTTVYLTSHDVAFFKVYLVKHRTKAMLNYLHFSIGPAVCVPVPGCGVQNDLNAPAQQQSYGEKLDIHKP